MYVLVNNKVFPRVYVSNLVITVNTVASESNNEQPVNTPISNVDDIGFDDSVLHEGKEN